MAASLAQPIFGENIDKSVFQNDLLSKADRLLMEGKSVYDLQEAKDEMSGEKNKYVFINILDKHASILVLDKILYETILCQPTWGQMLDGSNLEFRKNRLMAETSPMEQYQVCLDDSRSKYILTYNLYYMIWLKDSISFYVGETALTEPLLDLLCLTVAQPLYRLVMDDCLEFAKRFAKEIAVQENGISDRKIQAFFRTLAVCKHRASATVERASRNNPKSGLGVAISYFIGFKFERLLTLIIFIVVIFVLCNISYRSAFEKESGRLLVRNVGL